MAVNREFLEWARSLARSYYALKQMELGDGSQTPTAIATRVICRARDSASRVNFPVMHKYRG